jgi:hypothetical protein
MGSEARERLGGLRRCRAVADLWGSLVLLSCDSPSTQRQPLNSLAR